MPRSSVEVARATFSDCCRQTEGRIEVTTGGGKGPARARSSEAGASRNGKRAMGAERCHG
jgi:hypothetical protein